MTILSGLYLSCAFQTRLINKYPKPKSPLSTVKGNYSVLRSPFLQGHLAQAHVKGNYSVLYFPCLPGYLAQVHAQSLVVLPRMMEFMFTELEFDAQKLTINAALMIVCEIHNAQKNSGLDRILHVLHHMNMLKSNPILDTPTDQ